MLPSPQPQPLGESPSRGGGCRRELIGAVAVAIGFVCVVCVVAVLRFGSVGAFLAYVRGEEIFLEPGLIRIAESEPGGEVRMAARLVNLSGRTVQLYGSESSCSCALLERLPRALEAGSAVELKLKVHSPPRGGEFEGMVRVFTDSPMQDVLVLRFEGVVRGVEPLAKAMAADVNFIDLEPLPLNP